ncbi:STM3941 family protein [Sphingobacterium siyangense]|uniref:STM3941 family protein n=1 Tax=Sphingobacterium siyangense TaxID=459529 RepID=UPI002FDCC03D
MENKSENIIRLYSNKKKTVFMLIGSLLFVAGGIFFVMHAESFDREPLITRMIGILCILFFGLATIVFVRYLISSRLLLEITDQGLHIGDIHKTFIGWQDISGFKEIAIYSTPIIVILIKNSKAVIDDEPNMIKKKIMQFNMNYGSPYNLSSGNMHIRHKELFRLLNENLMKYSNNNM